ncbi:MAG TPA: hypothetical protein VM510_09890 [Caulifigura sp.]|nr:hypothetical protein [Caulifigura sp.]
MPGASPDEVADASIVAARPPSGGTAASARASSTGRPDFASLPIAGRDLALIVVQLVLCAILVWQFELEAKRHLLLALVISTAGFVVNVRLRPAWRRGWFAIVSAASVVAVLGIADGLLTLATAGTLIAAVRLPFSLGLRVGVVLLLAGVFTWLRSQSTAAFWPVVGSMFMFRMISYLHAARRDHAPRTLGEKAGYFLMLPNAFFPLFPVVDAKVFRDSWYNDEPRAISQKGVDWIATGLLHLVIYRAIKYDWLPSPLAVRSLSDVLLYLAANYALYLRVSGYFHVICGVLHLFGWNLPRTHDHYFLASSFSEIWRRINIYWKDFLMKTFFYPAFFALRGPLGRFRSGDAAAIAIAVVWVFSWTWLAHSWQMYWLNGVFPFHPAEGVMWVGVGLLVAGNAVRDYFRARRPRRERDATAWGPAMIQSLQIMGMFLLVSLFWARWTNREVFRYLLHVISTRAPTAVEITKLAGCGAAVFGALTAGQVLLGLRSRTRKRLDASDVLDRRATVHVIVLALVVAIGAPGGPVDLFGRTGRWFRGLQTERLTPDEEMAVVDGYYEQLASTNSQASPFLGDARPQGGGQGDVFTRMVRPRRDLLGFELIPGWRGQFDQSSLSVNRWGMRDRDRTLQKPQGTVRIAVVGNSPVMGYGVNDDQTFTRLLEQQLNEANTVAGRTYEVLNFGVGRYWAIHRRAQIDHVIRPFEPDIIIYVAHQDELFRTAEGLAAAVVNRTDLEDGCLDSVIREAGVSAADAQGAVQSALMLKLSDILRCTYQHISRSCQEFHARLLYVYLPIPGSFDIPIDPKSVLPIAAEAGMMTSDFTGWEQGRSRSEVLAREGADEHHPGPLGHRLIAERLAEVLKRERLLGP